MFVLYDVRYVYGWLVLKSILRLVSLVIGMDQKMEGLTVDFDHVMGFYNSSAGEGQNAGAYIFRPHTTNLYTCGGGVQDITIVKVSQYMKV